MFQRVEQMQTWNFLSERKAFIKFRSLPFNPMLFKSFMIQYLEVVFNAFSRSKNIAMRCCFYIIVSCMEVSNLTTWSIIDLRLLKPCWKWVKRLLDSITKLAFYWPFVPWSYTGSLLKLLGNIFHDSFNAISRYSKDFWVNCLRNS